MRNAASMKDRTIAELRVNSGIFDHKRYDLILSWMQIKLIPMSIRIITLRNGQSQIRLRQERRANMNIFGHIRF